MFTLSCLFQKCRGCGTTLQTAEELSPGYVPPKVFIRFEREQLAGKSSAKLGIVCQRLAGLVSCFLSFFFNISFLIVALFPRLGSFCLLVKRRFCFSLEPLPAFFC